MRCPNCGAENRPGARFCRRCAAPLSGTTAPGRAISGQASPVASLVVWRGPQAGRTFTLHEGTNTVGRAPDNDVLLSEESVSRHHVQIVVQPEGVWIQDVGSTIGTLVNGRRITGSTWLRSGDTVQVGGSVILGVQIAPVEISARSAIMAPPPAPAAAVPFATPLPTPAPGAAIPSAPRPQARPRRWGWAAGGVVALLVVVAAVGVLALRSFPGATSSGVVEETPISEGAVTEEQARQIVQEVVEGAFPQFVGSEPVFYRAEFEGKSFYQATYSASQTVTDGDGNPVEWEEIVSISVDKDTGEVSVAVSN